MINELKSNGKWKGREGLNKLHQKSREWRGKKGRTLEGDKARSSNRKEKKRGKRSYSGDTKRFKILSVLHFESCVGLAF